MKSELNKCVEFLLKNGAKFIEQSDDYMSYDFDGYGIDLCEDEIVFIGDIGDFAHIKCSYYELIGFMIDKSFIGVGYKTID